MLPKISVANLTNSAETLLIPLYSRALESQQGSSGFRDEKAVEIFNRLDYEFARIKAKALSSEGVILRAQEFDRQVAEFLGQNPGCVVVELGCGLDTRFYRLDNGSVTWFDLDIPEVITLRRQLLTEATRHRFIGRLVLDFTWIGEITVQPGQPVFFVAEALFPYLAENDVKALFLRLVEHYPCSEILFDSIPPILAGIGGRWHPNLWRMQATIRWGMGSAKTVERWSKDIHLIGECPYYLERSRRLNRFLRLFTFFFKEFKLVRFRLGEPGPRR